MAMYPRDPLHTHTRENIHSVLFCFVLFSQFIIIIIALSPVMQWNTRGRQAVAVFNPVTRHQITHAQSMRIECANKPLLCIIEKLIELKYIGGITGSRQRVELFLSCVFRLLQIHPAPPIILFMLRQDIHKYLRVAALVYIRLLGTPALAEEARRIGFQDYRKIRVYGQDLTSQASSTRVTPQYEQQRRLFGAGSKRAREEEAVEVLPSPNDGTQLESSSSSVRWYITHVDEVTEALFGKRKDRAAPQCFLGIPLPLLEWG